MNEKKIEKAFLKNVSKFKELAEGQKQLFAEAIVLYCLKNPDAILFIASATGGYNDEGNYKESFFARIDPAFVIEKVKNLPEEKKGFLEPTYTLAEMQLHWTTNKVNLLIGQREMTNPQSPFFQLEYGFLAKALRIKEFGVFVGATALKEAWQALGGKQGKAWRASEAHEMLGSLNLNYGSVLSKIESQALKEKLKTPKPTRKVL